MLLKLLITLKVKLNYLIKYLKIMKMKSERKYYKYIIVIKIIINKIIQISININRRNIIFK